MDGVTEEEMKEAMDNIEKENAEIKANESSADIIDLLDVFNEEDNLLEKLGIRKHVKPEDRNDDEKNKW